MSTDTGLTQHDISQEAWREYVWAKNGETYRYRIDDPTTLILKKYPNGRPGSTHRVVDAAGVVHLVPAIGELGCVVRYQPKDAKEPVQF